MSEGRSDFELLQAFSRRGDQGAFAGLVQRHVSLVYATAWRKTSDAGAAEEIAQNVFEALVKKSWQFAPDDSLPSWLYRTALLESKEWLRGELRRRRREQAAAEIGSTMNTPDEHAALRTLVPLLDEALLSLREKDRTALLLRFYEGQSLRSVGTALGVSEDTAQKRVSAALEKVSVFFQRRGFRTATAAATAAALQQTAVSAPAAVAASVLAASAQVAPVAMVGWTAFAARFAAWTKFQTAAACVAIAAAPVIWEWTNQSKAREQAAQFEATAADTAAKVSITRSEIDRLENEEARLTRADAEASAGRARRAAAADQLATWKKRLLALLADPKSRWPDDLPFVRIPKSALPHLNIDHPVAPPGIVEPQQRELLGLSPDERAQCEAALQQHYATLDDLINANVSNTNQFRNFTMPGDATAKAGWYVPPLGDAAASSATELETDLENILGADRWPLVQSQFNRGTDTLGRILDLEASEQPQAAGVWVDQVNGAWQLNWGTTLGYSTKTGSVPLDAVAAGADSGSAGGQALNYELSLLPNALSQRVLGWAQQQASTLLTAGGAQ